MPPRLPQVRKHLVGKLLVAFGGHGQQAKVEKTHRGKAVPNHGVPERDPSAPMTSSASLSERQEDQAAGLCFFSQFCSATSTRVFQPSPVARKLWTTFRDSRIVMRSLVGSFCAPRAPILRLRDSGNAFRAGRNAVRSLTVSSLTSPLASISGFCFGISIHLTHVGFAETDDADSVRRLGKAKNMQPNPEHTYRDIACFAVVLPFVDSIQSALEVKLSSRIER